MPYSAQNSIFICSSATVAATTNSTGTVGYVTGFSGPDGQSGELDITSFQSVAREYVLGVSDEGNISIDFLAQSSLPSHKNLVEAKQAGTLRSMKLRLSDPATSQLDFFGYVKSVSLTGAVDSPVTGSAAIRISGAVTWTTA